MAPVVAHLTLVYADRSRTRITGFGVLRLEALAAIWSRGTHYVALTTKMAVAFEALEVTHVPALSLCLRTFIGEDYLYSKKQNNLSYGERSL